MKNLVVKFKQGHVAYAHNFGGEVKVVRLENQTPFGFTKLAGAPDPGIYNVFWELGAILEEVYAFAKANPTELIQIAVPGTVSVVANNIDMLTRMVWSRKCLYTTGVNSKTRATVLYHRKKVADPNRDNGQYDLSDEEFRMYRALLLNMRKLIGTTLIIDSQFTCGTEANAKTEEQKAWFALNSACANVLGMQAKAGMSPWDKLKQQANQTTTSATSNTFNLDGTDTSDEDDDEDDDTALTF